MEPEKLSDEKILLIERLRVVEDQLKNVSNELKEAKTNNYIAPILTAIIAGILALTGSALGTYVQGKSNVGLERMKFEFTLVQKALEVETQEEAARKLAFLVKAGFLSDAKGKILSLSASRETLPIVPLEKRTLDQDWLTFLSTCRDGQGMIDYNTKACLFTDGREPIKFRSTS
jgi:hypothetical protein